MRLAWWPVVVCLGLVAAAQAPAPLLVLDETPPAPEEWGYRPDDGAVSRVTPPAFCWRPMRGIAHWELVVGHDRSFERIAYRAAGIRWNVHCPPVPLAAGAYAWRYRGTDSKGRTTAWSRTREFHVASGARELPLPDRQELLGRIPAAHPRLFLRPEALSELRRLARGKLAERFGRLVKDCDRLVANPPPTAEPPKYPPGTTRNSEEWRVIWWGNRTYTIRALDGAATLAFTGLIGDREEYLRLATRILLDCARWDPKGATGYRYNDEAGMPYAYHFSRAYTFLHDRLTDEQRETCRRVMAVRGREMYRHLCPRHLWRPYASHSNRAWHFLGEVGIAFFGEIPEAADWVWFAANVFACVYPVWSDEDGGWHEGSSYWASYLGRFTWWADVMRAALGIDAYRKPFFAEAGYYPLYLMPPGKVGGGFGDLTATRRARQNVPLVSALAAQAGNPEWQWYVERLGGPQPASGYVGFLRGALPSVSARPPDALPRSRLFRGTGQAVLNTTLADAREDVQVVFKASPFGTQSHGYEANNAFLLWAYGERLLIRSGRRDMYGSEHHRRWMWSTRSVNCITVDGKGQIPRSARARGEILVFRTSPELDVVVGEAGAAYRVRRDGREVRLLDRFTRTLVFVKPDLLLVHDRLVARAPSTFTYWLHAVNRLEVGDGQSLLVRAGDVACDARIYLPRGLRITQTDQYDPNPRPRIKLREWHLSATTDRPAERVEFLAIYRPRRAKEPTPPDAEVIEVAEGVAVRARTGAGPVAILIPAGAGVKLAALGLEAEGEMLVRLGSPGGERVERVRIR